MRNLFFALVLCACGGYDASIEGGDAAEDAFQRVRKGQGQVPSQDDAGTAQAGGSQQTGGLATGGTQTGGLATGGTLMGGSMGGTQSETGGTPGTGGAPACVPIAEALNGRDDDCDGAIDNGIPGVVQFKGRAYLFGTLDQNMFRPDAENYCKVSGYRMADVESAEENAFLLANMTQTIHHWLGIRDTSAEGVWQWDSGIPLTYTNWRAGQPSDCDKTKPDGTFDPSLPCGPEDCAVIGLTGWADLSCDRQKSKVLCEQI